MITLANLVVFLLVIALIVTVVSWVKPQATQAALVFVIVAMILHVAARGA
jgi:hypothetical protein